MALLGSRDKIAENTSYSDIMMLSSFGCSSGRELGFGRDILLDLNTDLKNLLKRFALLMSEDAEAPSRVIVAGRIDVLLIE